MTSTGADSGGDSWTTTTGEGTVLQWVGLRAGIPTPPTQHEPEIAREAATAEILAMTAPDQGREIS